MEIKCIELLLKKPYKTTKIKGSKIVSLKALDFKTKYDTFAINNYYLICQNFHLELNTNEIPDYIYNRLFALNNKIYRVIEHYTDGSSKFYIIDRDCKQDFNIDTPTITITAMIDY